MRKRRTKESPKWEIISEEGGRGVGGVQKEMNEKKVFPEGTATLSKSLSFNNYLSGVYCGSRAASVFWLGKKEEMVISSCFTHAVLHFILSLINVSDFQRRYFFLK